MRSACLAIEEYDDNQHESLEQKMKDVAPITEDTVSASESRIDTLRHIMLYVAWGQAIIATIGSLFFSEIMGYVPCSLCWYQRILMYPLVVVLAVGILRRDDGIRSYVLPLSGLGFAIALYHNLLYFGFIPEDTIRICTVGASCRTRWFEWFGFISIPQLSLIAFTVIIVAMLWYRRKEVEDLSGDEAIEDQPSDLAESQPITTKTVLLTVCLSVLLIGTLVLGMMKNLSNVINAPRLNPVNTPETSASTIPNKTGDSSVYDVNLTAEGRTQFSRTCTACHGTDARGVPNLGPSLIGNTFTRDSTDAALRMLIINGRSVSDPMNKTGQPMPAKGGNPALTNQEVSALIAFLRSLNRD